MGFGQPVGDATSEAYINRPGLTHMIADPREGDLDENSLLDYRDLFTFSNSWITESGETDYRFTADLITSPQDRRINHHDLLRMLEVMGDE